MTRKRLETDMNGKESPAGCRLDGKKLLILGGGSDMISVTHLAQSMGCIVYVADYYDTLRSPAKLAADHYSNISIFDTDLVVQYIRDNQIDGVMTGYTDSYLMQYMTICKAAGLPYYGSEKAFGVATDKMLFKRACIENDVGAIPGTNAYDFASVEAFAAENGFPLMLKPTDNSGSRGVIKCEEPSQLRSCYDYAMSYSKAKNIIVEKYMDCDSVVCSYQLAGDKAYLSAFCDRDIYKSVETGSAYTSQARYPSPYLDRFLLEENDNMKRLFKNNGFSDGMVGVMGYVDEKGFYWCEMTYRPSGGHHYTLIKDQNGIDGLALLIEFAVTGETRSYDPKKENPRFREYCGMIHIPGISGKKIASISGMDEIAALPFVLEVCEELRAGQMVGKEGTTAQTVASFWIKGQDRLNYDNNVKKAVSMLKVCDPEGQSVLK